MTFIDHITSTASSWMTSLGKNEREEHCSDRQTLIFNSLGFRKLKHFTYPLSRPTKLKLEDPGCSIFKIRHFYCANNSLAFDIEANWFLRKMISAEEWPQIFHTNDASFPRSRTVVFLIGWKFAFLFGCLLRLYRSKLFGEFQLSELQFIDLKLR